MAEPKIGRNQLKLPDHIDGFVVGYSDTDVVSITSGNIMANGKYYTLSSDDTHTMTSLSSLLAYHYVYIDDSASTAPTATIIDSATEPAWSGSKRGWYNGDDRMIGLALSPILATTIAPFIANELSGKSISVDTGGINGVDMATTQVPDGTYQTPNIKDGSEVTPVNATALKFFISNRHIGDRAANHVSSAEFAALVSNLLGSAYYSFGEEWDGGVGIVELGASRNVKIAGDDNDENTQDMEFKGFRYSR